MKKRRLRGDLIRAERDIVLDAISTLEFDAKHNQERACPAAEIWLRGNSRYCDSSIWGTWVHWLGAALCHAGILEWPDFEEENSPFFSKVYAQTCDIPMYNDPAWYWPVDLLLWGCKEYVRRRDTKKQK